MSRRNTKLKQRSSSENPEKSRDLPLRSSARLKNLKENPTSAFTNNASSKNTSRTKASPKANRKSKYPFLRGTRNVKKPLLVKTLQTRASSSLKNPSSKHKATSALSSQIGGIRRSLRTVSQIKHEYKPLDFIKAYRHKGFNRSTPLDAPITTSPERPKISNKRKAAVLPLPSKKPSKLSKTRQIKPISKTKKFVTLPQNLPSPAYSKIIHNNTQYYIHSSLANQIKLSDNTQAIVEIVCDKIASFDAQNEETSKTTSQTNTDKQIYNNEKNKSQDTTVNADLNTNQVDYSVLKSPIRNRTIKASFITSTPQFNKPKIPKLPTKLSNLDSCTLASPDSKPFNYTLDNSIKEHPDLELEFDHGGEPNPQGNQSDNISHFVNYNEESPTDKRLSLTPSEPPLSLTPLKNIFSPAFTLVKRVSGVSDISHSEIHSESSINSSIANTRSSIIHTRSNSAMNEDIDQMYPRISSVKEAQAGAGAGSTGTCLSQNQMTGLQLDSGVELGTGMDVNLNLTLDLKMNMDLDFDLGLDLDLQKQLGYLPNQHDISEAARLGSGDPFLYSLCNSENISYDVQNVGEYRGIQGINSELAEAGNGADAETEADLSIDAAEVSIATSVCSSISKRSTASTDADSEFDIMEFDPYTFMSSVPPIPEEYIDRPFALPPKSSDAKSINLVLDLDETLVHCSVTDLPSADFTFPVEFGGQNYQVFCGIRPHLLYFLEKVSQMFEVTVFTASQKIYADKLLDHLDPDRKLIQHRVFRDSCVYVLDNYVKDLTVLGRNLETTVIVDNAPQAFAYQQSNGIPIESWYDDPNDTELLKLLGFLETLVGVSDVRPIVEAAFGTIDRVNLARLRMENINISINTNANASPNGSSINSYSSFNQLSPPTLPPIPEIHKQQRLSLSS